MAFSPRELVAERSALVLACHLAYLEDIIDVVLLKRAAFRVNKLRFCARADQPLDLALPSQRLRDTLAVLVYVMPSVAHILVAKLRLAVGNHLRLPELVR